MAEPTATQTQTQTQTQTLARTHPLTDRMGAQDPMLATAGCVSVRPLMAMALVRADAGGAAQALERELGTALPTRPNTWVATGHSPDRSDGSDGSDGSAGTVVWLGPDEWLVMDPGATPWELEDRLRAAAVPAGGSAVDVSAQRLVLRLHGPHARDLLSSGCSLDTHPSTFGAGAAAQVLLAQAGVVLIARSDSGDDYDVLVRSSFARYLTDWLVDACVEYQPSTP